MDNVVPHINPMLDTLLAHPVTTYPNGAVTFFIDVRLSEWCLKPKVGFFEFPTTLTTSFASRSTTSLSLSWHCSYLVLDKIRYKIINQSTFYRFRKPAVRVDGFRSLACNYRSEMAPIYQLWYIRAIYQPYPFDTSSGLPLVHRQLYF